CLAILAFNSQSLSMEGTNIFTLCAETVAVMMMGVSAIAVSAANNYPPAPAPTSDASTTYIVIAAVASFSAIMFTLISILVR
ncbi:hypothetical protein Tco_0251106, partial [Tanacetum coccineum]